jgi:hypothetical protein
MLENVTPAIAELVARARALPREEQAELAGEILALLDENVDDPDVAEREWAEEITRRVERADAREGEARPWDDVRERLIAKLRRQ